MTPTQLIDRLKLPHDEVDRIKALTSGFAQLEALLGKAQEKQKNTGSAFEQGIRTSSHASVNLIAEILHEKPEVVEKTLLTLLGLTEGQYKAGESSTSDIIAFSALVQGART